MEERKLLEMVETMRASGKFSALRKLLCEMNVVDIAQAIKGLETEDLLRVFRILPKDVSVGVFSYFGTDTQARLVQAIPDSELEALIEDLFIDDTVDFLQDAPEEVVKRVLARMEPEERKLVNQFLNYPCFSAGSLMTVEFVELNDSMNVTEAIALIRKTGAEKVTVNSCYCVDYSRRLIGTVPLKNLLLCDEKTLVRDVMDDDDKLIFVRTGDNQKKVIDIARKYDLCCLPVVDEERKLVGIITIDDIIDVFEEENTKDFEKLASLLPSERKYLKTSVFTLTKNRILGLLILMITAIFSGMIIESFDGMLTAVIGLAAAIPLLMGVSGNAGLQSSTLIIRGLSLGELRTSDYFKIIFKEIRVALLCGIALALVNFARMYFFSAGEMTLYLVVCAALVCSVVIAKLIGCTLPILLKVMRQNPAHVSGPLLTTIVDASALAVYFTLAKVMLG